MISAPHAHEHEDIYRARLAVDRGDAPVSDEQRAANPNGFRRYVYTSVVVAGVVAAASLAVVFLL